MREGSTKSLKLRGKPYKLIAQGYANNDKAGDEEVEDDEDDKEDDDTDNSGEAGRRRLCWEKKVRRGVSLSLSEWE